ncbi:hypothetical protein B0H34DRAFT_522875 [Crassisporium funariophilum]|nr:hypothetical protein B0H34DRAFT_522875 [Crassisporium funariophilum]
MHESTTRSIQIMVARLASHRPDPGEATATMVSLVESTSFQNYSCLSALIFLLWDYIDSFGDEIKFVWSKPWSPVRCAYLYTRYFGFSWQLANYVYLVVRVSRLHMPSDVCRWWFGVQTVALWTLYAASDMVLMLRVYALHRHSSRVGAFLIALHVSETVMACVLGSRMIKAVVFDSACNGIEVPIEPMIFAFGVILSQCIVWTMTIRKRNVTNGTQVPVVNIVFRDGKWALIVFCAIFATSIPLSFSRQSAKPHIIFSCVGFNYFPRALYLTGSQVANGIDVNCDLSTGSEHTKNEGPF